MDSYVTYLGGARFEAIREALEEAEKSRFGSG